MGISLSGGDYQYNRFDAYEASLEEGKHASDPEKMKKKVDKAAKKSRKTGRDLRDEDEKEEGEEEAGTAEGGGGMSEGYKPEGDNFKPPVPTQKDIDLNREMEAKKKAREKADREKVDIDKSGNRKMVRKPAKPGIPRPHFEEVESFFIEDEEGNIYEGKKDACYHKVKSRYDVWPSAYASGALVKCRKAGAKNWGNSSKKESFVDEFGNEYLLELNSTENTETVMENRMAMYSRALGVMGAHYSGPVVEKKAAKDYDGDGKVESGKEEYFGSKDKAIKKAMAKEEVTVEEGYKEMDPKRAENQAKGKGRHENAEQGRKIRLASAAHNDPKVGGMARAAVKDQEQRNRAKGENKRGLEKAFKKDSKDHPSMEEEVSITKEMVVEYLVSEGYASNEVSAEILHTHISDEFLAQIEESMISE